MTEKLALYGGKMSVTTPIAKYNPIGDLEAKYVADCVNNYPLSGYLGGRERGGHWVQCLEQRWSAKFGVRHAIAVNSATSGLLAAARACKLNYGTHFVTTPFTMSATSAAAFYNGSVPIFAKIDYADCNLDPLHAETMVKKYRAQAIIVTNLFGAPARLMELREAADRHGAYLIEDNAQAICATENGRYAGTIGHIGVFSLNVHKHIQCGEGGVVVTNDDALAERMRQFINHGELFGRDVGLNLRMPEVCAAIAVAQLDRVDELVDWRIKQAEELKTALKPFEMWALTNTHTKFMRPDIKHVYYLLPFIYRANQEKWPSRELLLKALAAEGVPLVGGYVEPLTSIIRPHYNETDSLTLSLHRETLFYFSNCEWTLYPQQIEEISNAFQKVWDNVRAGNLKATSNRVA